MFRQEIKDPNGFPEKNSSSPTLSVDKGYSCHSEFAAIKLNVWLQDPPRFATQINCWMVSIAAILSAESKFGEDGIDSIDCH